MRSTLVDVPQNTGNLLPMFICAACRLIGLFTDVVCVIMRTFASMEMCKERLVKVFIPKKSVKY